MHYGLDHIKYANRLCDFSDILKILGDFQGA
jgi:hypothetical protein